MYRERQWSNLIAPSAWMSTLPSLRDTTTQMEPTLALVSPICSLWYIQSTGLRGLVISLFLGKKLDWFEDRKVVNSIELARLYVVIHIAIIFGCGRVLRGWSKNTF